MSETAREGVPPAQEASDAWGGVAMSMATMEAVQMREESQRRGMLVVKRSIAEAQAQGESYAEFKARYRPVGIDGKLKDMWADVATQTRRDAETSALITKETGIANADKLARAAAARLTPEWDRSSRNGGPSSCRWCDETFGLTMWQYNCRACGWKVCGECSPNEMELMQWLEGHKPHELRREPSNARLRVCVGCWYAAHAAAAREAAAREASTLGGSGGDGSDARGDHAATVKGLVLLDQETLRSNLSTLTREDLLLLVCTAVEAASQTGGDGSTAHRAETFLAEVSARSQTGGDGSTAHRAETFLAEVSARSVSCSDGSYSPTPASTVLRQSQLATLPTAAAATTTSTVGHDEDHDVSPLPGAHSSCSEDLGVMQRDPHAVFVSLDVDGNGRLSEIEIREFCQQLGRALDAETISDTLHEMDIDRDGVVGWMDFEGWWHKNGGNIDGGGGDSLPRRQKHKQQGRLRLGTCCSRPQRTKAVQRQSEWSRSDKESTPASGEIRVADIGKLNGVGEHFSHDDRDHDRQPSSVDDLDLYHL